MPRGKQCLSLCLQSPISGRNKSIGCAVGWVTIARDSESEYPFHPVGANLQGSCRTLMVSDLLKFNKFELKC